MKTKQSKITTGRKKRFLVYGIFIIAVIGIMQLIILNDGSLIFWGKSHRDDLNKPGKKLPLRVQFKTLSGNSMRAMLRVWNFYDADWNPSGDFSNRFQLKVLQGDNVVRDDASGLMWHQSGSSACMSFQEINEWLDWLNGKSYAGFKDWRLPTVEEAATLIESSRKNGALHIDGLFSDVQNWLWTGDRYNSTSVWVIGFYGGGVDAIFPGNISFVRPVRNIQENNHDSER